MARAASTKPSAGELIALLETKHAADIGFAECKTGPSTEGLLKLDYWAMTPSWANFRAYGYEVKVSRGDFLGDVKWRGYLPYCTDFYFVAPPGIIRADELPAEAGLLELAKTGSRFFTRKKAPSRDVRIPQEILVYALMWRTRKTKEPLAAREFAAGRLDAIEAGRELGSKLAKGLAVERNEVARKRRELEGFRRDIATVNAEVDAAEIRLRELRGLIRKIDGGPERLLAAIEGLRADVAAMIGQD